MRNRSFPLFIALLFIFSIFFCQSAYSGQDPLKSSVQLSLGYDDNVFKTYDTGENDGLLRLLLKTRKRFRPKKSLVGLDIQLGGKKYFSLEEQDTAIGQMELGWQTRTDSNPRFGISTKFKGQLENKSEDAAGTDINEDFISSTSKLHITFPLVFEATQRIYSKFNFFEFFGQMPIDSFEERVGTVLKRKIIGPFVANLGYDFSLSQFPNSPAGDRRDTQHEISFGTTYYGPTLVSLGYAYRDNNSSEDFFSSTGHKVTLLVSMAFYSSAKQRAAGKVEDITIHLLGTLQILGYPAVFISDAEGRRLLFSDSEDNNFNGITVKMTKRFTRHLTAEFKYSRYSNELSDQEAPFSRNLFMLGLRASF